MPIRRILLVLLLSLSQGALAECFCLIDEDDAVWFGCVSQKRPLKPHPVIFCRSPVSGAREKIANGHRLRQVQEGAGPCKPCRLEDAGKHDAIRGSGEEDRTQEGEPEEIEK